MEEDDTQEDSQCARSSYADEDNNRTGRWWKKFMRFLHVYNIARRELHEHQKETWTKNFKNPKLIFPPAYFQPFFPKIKPRIYYLIVLFSAK